jgi:hypothetical protein
MKISVSDTMDSRRDQPRRLLLRLELAAEGDEVAFRQRLFGDHRADVGDDLGQRPPLRVGRDDDAPPAVVAADLVRAVASSMLASFDSGTGPPASRSGSGAGRRPRAAFRQRTSRSKRRLPSTICVTFSPSTSICSVAQQLHRPTRRSCAAARSRCGP